ncbi:MAG: dephospho-CoA kinase [Desulfitobacteriaceae bacterium]
MLIIGLTGGIGSGKSSVAKWFKEQGIPVLDADQIVHSLFNNDQALLTELVKEFGEGILDTQGKINRQVLGRKIFDNDQARHKLEKIVHPRVSKKMRQEQIKLEKEGVQLCVWDVPLLLEGGLKDSVDQVWVVWVPREVQIQRVLGRDKLTREEIMARIVAQMPLDDKVKLANVVIDNSGNWSQTQNQLIDLFKNLKD